MASNSSVPDITSTNGPGQEIKGESSADEAVKSSSPFLSTFSWPGEADMESPNGNDIWGPLPSLLRIPHEEGGSDADDEAEEDGNDGKNGYPFAIRRYMSTNERLSLAAFDEVMAKDVDDPVESINGDRYVAHHVYAEMEHRSHLQIAELIQQLAGLRKEGDIMRSRISELEERLSEYEQEEALRLGQYAKRGTLSGNSSSLVKSSNAAKVAPTTKIPTPVKTGSASARLHFHGPLTLQPMHPSHSSPEGPMGSESGLSSERHASSAAVDTVTQSADQYDMRELRKKGIFHA